MKPVWKLGEQKTLTLEIPLQPPPPTPHSPVDILQLICCRSEFERRRS